MCLCTEIELVGDLQFEGSDRDRLVADTGRQISEASVVTEIAFR